MNKKYLRYLLSVCLIFTFTFVFAFKTPPLPKGADGPAPPVGLPIDGGISFLIISGVFLGSYTLRKRK